MDSFTPDQALVPGYYPEGWSAKDALAHIGTWLAEAGVALEQLDGAAIDEGAISDDLGAWGVRCLNLVTAGNVAFYELARRAAGETPAQDPWRWRNRTISASTPPRSIPFYRPFFARCGTEPRTWVLTGDHPADGAHELLGLLLGIIGTTVASYEAVADVPIQETEGNLVQRRSRRIDLRHNLYAVPVLFDHPGHSPDLPLDPRQP
jgi:hypothetical protein